MAFNYKFKLGITDWCALDASVRERNLAVARGPSIVVGKVAAASRRLQFQLQCRTVD